ncbi:MAG TPA: hypothetical protein VLJ37_01690 [bacterium]|nr:hypothetical protein [bacterium]
MSLNPAQLTVFHLRVLSQLEILQGTSHLAGISHDFSQTLEVSLNQAYRYMTAVRGGEAPALAAGLWSADAFRQRIGAILGQVIRFQPGVAPDFHPLQAILRRGIRQEPFPVIIEKVSYEEAESLATFRSMKRELKEFELLKVMDTMEPMVFLMRGWGGEVRAMAIAALHDDREEKTMLCCRDVKFDRNRMTALQGVGAVLTLARLIYMKRAGHLNDAAPILRDIRPPVLRAYRSHFPHLPPVRGEQGEWHITRAEAEHFLLHSPVDLIELPLAPAEAPSI